MFTSVYAAISDHLSPLFRKPRAQQMAALCHRDTPIGREVLMVTSSHGRWILPKGWPIEGKTGAETAAQEAWEEAGVKPARINDEPLGHYKSIKHRKKNDDIHCVTDVFEIAVKDIVHDFPEADSRARRWVSFDEAARLVDNDALREIIMAFAADQASRPN